MQKWSVPETVGNTELAGVLAHEIAHVRNDDLRVMHAADMVGRMTRILSRLGAVMVFLPFLFWVVGVPKPPVLVGFVLMVAPLSRTRELEADLDAVELTGDPTGLSLALHKLDMTRDRMTCPNPSPTTP